MPNYGERSTPYGSIIMQILDITSNSPRLTLSRLVSSTVREEQEAVSEDPLQSLIGCWSDMLYSM